MANRIMLNQTSYHGAGAIREIPNEVKSRGFQKALICCGPTLLKHGVIAKVTGLLDEAGLAYERYSDIKPSANSGLVMMMPMALEVSMGEPPPMAIR